MDGFAARLREGFVTVRNPFNRHQVRRVDLSPEDTQFVFWTKNAGPMLPFLPLLEPYPFYVHCTITPYGPDIEPGLRPQAERIDALRRLSDAIGPDRVIWRCDPFIWSDRMSSGWLADRFGELAAALSGWAGAAVVSFVDLYRCMRARFRAAGLRAGTPEEVREVAGAVRLAAAESGLPVTACCEPDTADLLPASRCIDADRLARVAGRPLAAARDRHQRPGCGCHSSIDIGLYNTCRHGCLYCYAVRGTPAAATDTGSGLLPDGETAQ